MNKMRFTLLLGLFLLLGWATPLATRPAGATPHQPSSSLLLPGDENWLPGFENGFAGLSHADMGLITADNLGGFYATGQFDFPYLANSVSVVHYRNGQWTPIILPAPYTDIYYNSIPNLHVAANGDLYIQVNSNGSALLRWADEEIQILDLNPFGYDNPTFLGTDALSRPYISGAVTYSADPTYIQQWDGTQWVLIGTAQNPASPDTTQIPAHQRPPGPMPGANSGVTRMVFDNQNNLYFSGYFTEINSVPMTSLAKWDGNNWTAVANPLISVIHDLEIDVNGQLYIAGWQNEVDSWTIAYLNQGSWVTHLANDFISNIEVHNPQQLFVTGHFTEIGGAAAKYLASWNGNSWGGVGNLQPVSAYPSIAIDSQNQLFLAEDLFKVGSETGVGTAKWNGTQWQAFDPAGQGVDGAIYALAVNPEGQVYAAGAFKLAGDKLVSGLALWDGTEWQTVGDSVTCQNCVTAAVTDLAVAPNGELYITGQFDTIGSVPANQVAKWDGTQRVALGNGPFIIDQHYVPQSIVVNSQNHVFVTTDTDVDQWDGTEWISIGGDTALDLVLDQNDLLYGAFDEEYVSVWDGTTWTQLGDELPGLMSLALSPDNQIYAVGRFVRPAGAFLALGWDGTAWQPVGPALALPDVDYPVEAGLFDTAGNLYLTGHFEFEHEGQTFAKIARWDGTNLSPLGSGLGSQWGHRGEALALNNTGQLFVGGQFNQAGTTPSYNLAVWSLPIQKCGLGAGGSHQFYGSLETVVIEVDTAGTLDCVVMQQHRANHPAAPHNLRTGYWWEIVALDTNRQPAGGFEVDLTLPFTMFPAEADDKLCFQTNTGWDCASATFNGQTITREGVTQFGAWAVETTLFRTALPVVIKR